MLIGFMLIKKNVYLAIQSSNVLLVGRPIGNVTLLSTFLAVHYL